MAGWQGEIVKRCGRVKNLHKDYTSQEHKDLETEYESDACCDLLSVDAPGLV